MSLLHVHLCIHSLHHFWARKPGQGSRVSNGIAVGSLPPPPLSHNVGQGLVQDEGCGVRNWPGVRAVGSEAGPGLRPCGSLEKC